MYVSTLRILAHTMRLTAHAQSGRSAEEALKGVDLNCNVEAL